MNRLRRGVACAAFSLAASLISATPSVAQQDTVRAPTDSTVVDSLATTDAEIPRVTVLPIGDPEVPIGPLTPGTRYSFTRDSLLWSGAVTLADLLTRIPGVYVARAGFVGQPEYIQYGGRGGNALEIYWDGVRWEALGGDTLFVDAGTFPLTYLRRVDVEVQPARLRVFLVSERHELLDVRSKVRVEQGAFKTARYTALFQKRARNGVSVDLAAQFVGTDGPSKTAGSDAFDVWAKLGWSPNGKVGATYQIRRQDIDRDPLNGIPARMGTRADYQLGLYAGTRADGMGLRARGGVVTSTWSADSGSDLTNQSLQHAYAALRYRRASWSVEALGRIADQRTPYSLEARAGWVPIRGVVISGDARWQQHEGDRESTEIHGAAGLYLGPLYVAGEMALGEAVQTPALPFDTAQRTVDRAVRAGIRTKWLSGQFSLVRRDAYDPRPYPELMGPIPALGSVPATTYLVAEATVRPVSALALSGWFADPSGGEPSDLQPPQHWRAALTLRSKFWRTFRSGAFDLRAQIAVESWGAGTAGQSETGSAIALPSATFWEMHLEIQLVDFTAFWSLRNARLSDAEFVPGLTYPGNGQLFGASWVFAN
ncbi:MAG: TonB-dependent receptor [Gemmatimonadota bacterium]|nr:TonB-dependent receptor [Gemmatimonadota bacterium]